MAENLDHTQAALRGMASQLLEVKADHVRGMENLVEFNQRLNSIENEIAALHKYLENLDRRLCKAGLTDNQPYVAKEKTRLRAYRNCDG